MIRKIVFATISVLCINSYAKAENVMEPIQNNNNVSTVKVCNKKAHEIYIRGLGWVFSGGLDALAHKRCGVLLDWYEADAYAEKVCADSSIKVIKIAGHSLGGGRANALNNKFRACGKRVAVLATLDPNDPIKIIPVTPIIESNRHFVVVNPLIHGIMTQVYMDKIEQMFDRLN